MVSVLLGLIPACVTCGAGTVEVDGACVAADDTGVLTTDTGVAVTDPDDDDDGDGVTPAQGDCDDDDPDVNPDATEICNDDVDNDCDGQWAECRWEGSLGPGDAAATLSGGGLTLSFAGLVADQDGDGRPDFAVGGAQSGQGKVLVFSGTSTGSLSAAGAIATLSGAEHMDQAWTTGDLGGNGQQDWLLGARLHSGGGSGSGIAYVFQGTASGSVNLGQAADGSFTTGTAGAYLGTAVAIGDVDGGGGDAIVGAPSSGRDADGAVYVFSGGFSGSATAAKASAVLRGDSGSPPYLGEAGASLAVLDLNGDGTDDLAIGATGAQHDAAIFIVHGPIRSDVDLVADADLRLDNDDGYDETGRVLSLAGDTDNDGLPDLWIGAPANDGGSNLDEAGRVWLVRGPGASGNLRNSDASVYGQSEDGWLGSSVTGGGDLDGDGTADVVVGALYEDSYAGHAYVLYGPFSGATPSNQTDATFSGGSGQYTGRMLGTLGDADGDGLDDVGLGSTSAAWLLHGSGL